MAIALSLSVQDRERRADEAIPRAVSLRQILLELGATLTGAEQRLPNFASCTFAARKGEDMLLALDLAGVATSSGSACASGSLDPSHVLLAMGMTMEQALGSLRMTTGYASTDAEMEIAISVLRKVLGKAAVRA